jgi:hypothetical protein
MMQECQNLGSHDRVFDEYLCIELKWGSAMNPAGFRMKETLLERSSTLCDQPLATEQS